MTTATLPSSVQTLTRTWRAMGSTAEVIVVADPAIAEDLLALAEKRIAILQDRWTRFVPGSELNRLNDRAGQGPVLVSEDLLVLVATMLEGWQSTGGLFDPTVLPVVRAHGYDRDFADVVALDYLTGLESVEAVLSEDDVVGHSTPGLADVVLDTIAGTIELPAGIGLDPGAIGKGLAADLVLEELLSVGAEGALVSLGGDLAFAGRSPEDAGWTIAVEDERVVADAHDRAITTWTFTCDRGAVATSTTRKRRWAHGTRHHSIDPRTGRLSRSDVVQATVIADRAWIAETSATAALVLDSDAAATWLADRELPALLLTESESIDLTDPSTTSRTRSAHV